MNKKGIFTLALLFVIEIVIFVGSKKILPPSIIFWSGGVSLSYIIFWIIHISITFFIFNHYFLYKKINLYDLILIIAFLLIIRIAYDYCFSVYIKNKTNSMYFVIAKICLCGEIIFSTILCMLFFVSAKLRGYYYCINRKGIYRIGFFFVGVIICICIALRLLQSLSDYNTGNSISYLSVATAFLFNIFFEYIINFLVWIILLSNFKRKS